MSSFIKQVGDKKFYCLDNFFGSKRYGFLESQEADSGKQIEIKPGEKNQNGRTVMNEEEFDEFCNTINQ